MAPDTMIQVRDFDTDKIGFALPTSRLGGYDDIIERAYVPLFKHRRVFDAHLHLSREGCGKRVDKPRWERGEYVVGKLVVVYVHFVRRDGVDDYGFPLKKTGEEVEEEEESEEELSSDSDVDQTPTATAQVRRLLLLDDRMVLIRGRLAEQWALLSCATPQISNAFAILQLMVPACHQSQDRVQLVPVLSPKDL